MSLYAHELDIGLGPVHNDTCQKNEYVLQSQRVQSHWTLDPNLPKTTDDKELSL